MEYSIIYNYKDNINDLQQFDLHASSANEAYRLFRLITQNDPIKVVAVTTRPYEILNWHNCLAEADVNGKCTVCGAVRPTADQMRRSWYAYCSLSNAEQKEQPYVCSQKESNVRTKIIRARKNAKGKNI